MTGKRHQVYAALLAVGAGILLTRTLLMLAEGALGVLVPWVSALLILECSLASLTVLASLRWWASGTERDAQVALRTGAVVTVLHAVRVLIFVLGRTGPWVDFDVRPAQRALHPERWSWGEVYFASVLSVLGLAAVVFIWQILRTRRRARR